MRASRKQQAVPSFKDELARFDFRLHNIYVRPPATERGSRTTKGERRFVASPAVKPPGEDKPPRYRSDWPTRQDDPTLAHFDRWAKSDRAEKVWTKIKKAAPDLEAGTFIRDVLDARYDAVMRLAEESEYKYDTWYERKKISKLVRSCRSIPEIIAVLEKEADWLRFREGAYRIRHSGQGASRKGDLRAVKLFVQQIGCILHAQCNRWLDDEVTILVEIAFPGRMLDADQIKAMRRPTTARERGKGRKTPSH
jgi:hypothetical protein